MGFAPIYTGHEPVMLTATSIRINFSPRGVRTLVCNDENIMS